MKIAFIGGRDIRKLGGIESYMYHLASELKMKGHEPVVYCESDKNSEEIVNGFRVVYQKSVGGRFLCKILLSYKSTIMSLIRNEKFDIYHYNAWPPSLASWIPKLFGKKVILQGHGFEWKRTKYSSFQKKIMKLMEYLTAKLHHNIIMVSQEQTDYFMCHYKRNCVTIPTATNIPSSSICSNILSTFDLKPNSYFLYLGRLVQEKNPDYLIRAYKKSNIKTLKLVIAGNNEFQSDYVEYLKKVSGDDKNIIFTGAVYNDDKNMLLKECYAFCIPSTIEGLSITLLEAMSFGKICIASDIPANKEALAASGVWCQYENDIDLADKLKYTVSHYGDLLWQGQYNYKRVKDNFTWESVSNKYIRYIENL